MALFSDTPTPIIPLPTHSKDAPLSEQDVVGKLRAGLRVLEGEILEILEPQDGGPALSSDTRERLLLTRRRIHDLERLAHEQNLLRALSQGDRVSDVWPVDLLGLVQVVSEPLAASYRLDHKPLCVETDEDAVVSADPRLLRHALETLITCGLEHSLPKTPVMVYLTQDGEAGVATVHVGSRGCEWHDEHCDCLVEFEERLGARLHFCSVIAQSNGGWIAYDLQASKSLDLAMALPLVGGRAPTKDSGAKDSGRSGKLSLVSLS